MFEIPDAKRIRRAELFSTSSSPSPSPPDPALSALLHAQLSEVYGPITQLETLPTTEIPPPANEPHGSNHRDKPRLDPSHSPGAARDQISGEDPDNDAEESEEGFEFRLFVTPRNHSRAQRSEEAGDDGTEPSHRTGNSTSTSSRPTTTATTRIILSSDSDSDGDYNDQQGGHHHRRRRRRQGAFVVPGRSPSYYFTGADTAAARAARTQRCRDVALDGAAVRRFRERAYTGWAVPWRVQVLSMVDGETPGGGGGGGGVEEEDKGERDRRRRRRVKPGKKRRIVERMRKRKVEEERENKIKEAREMEVADREKRTRRNREKKVKRKAKEKAKKVAVVATAG